MIFGDIKELLFFLYICQCTKGCPYFFRGKKKPTNVYRRVMSGIDSKIIHWFQSVAGGQWGEEG